MRNSLKSFVFAVFVQVLILCSTFFWVVMKKVEPREVVFDSSKSVHLSKKTIRKKKEIESLRRVNSSLLEIDAFAADRIQVNLDMASSMVATFPSSLSMGIGDDSSFVADALMADSLELVDLPESRLVFMGVESDAERVLILFDISSSVKNKLEKVGRSMESVRDATKKLVGTFNSNTTFGLIQFSRKYDCFKEDLLPATKKNKALALEWLDTRFKTNGQSGRNWVNQNPNGIESVLMRAFEMNPDVIFLVSDGDFQRNPISGRRGNENVSFSDLSDLLIQLQKGRSGTVEFHFIGVEVKAKHEVWMESLCRKWDGLVRRIED